MVVLLFTASQVEVPIMVAFKPGDRTFLPGSFSELFGFCSEFLDCFTC